MPENQKTIIEEGIRLYLEIGRAYEFLAKTYLPKVSELIKNSNVTEEEEGYQEFKKECKNVLVEPIKERLKANLDKGLLDFLDTLNGIKRGFDSLEKDKLREEILTEIIEAGCDLIENRGISEKEFKKFSEHISKEPASWAWLGELTNDKRSIKDSLEKALENPNIFFEKITKLLLSKDIFTTEISSIKNFFKRLSENIKNKSKVELALYVKKLNELQKNYKESGDVGKFIQQAIKNFEFQVAVFTAFGKDLPKFLKDFSGSPKDFFAKFKENLSTGLHKNFIDSSENISENFQDNNKFVSIEILEKYAENLNKLKAEYSKENPEFEKYTLKEITKAHFLLEAFIGVVNLKNKGNIKEERESKKLVELSPEVLVWLFKRQFPTVNKGVNFSYKAAELDSQVKDQIRGSYNIRVVEEISEDFDKTPTESFSYAGKTGQGNWEDLIGVIKGKIENLDKNSKFGNNEVYLKQCCNFFKNFNQATCKATHALFTLAPFSYYLKDFFLKYIDNTNIGVGSLIPDTTELTFTPKGIIVTVKTWFCGFPVKNPIKLPLAKMSYEVRFLNKKSDEDLSQELVQFFDNVKIEKPNITSDFIKSTLGEDGYQEFVSAMAINKISEGKVETKELLDFEGQEELNKIIVPASEHELLLNDFSSSLDKAYNDYLQERLSAENDKSAFEYEKLINLIIEIQQIQEFPNKMELLVDLKILLDIFSKDRVQNHEDDQRRVCFTYFLENSKVGEEDSSLRIESLLKNIENLIEKENMPKEIKKEGLKEFIENTRSDLKKIFSSESLRDKILIEARLNLKKAKKIDFSFAKGFADSPNKNKKIECLVKISKFLEILKNFCKAYLFDSEEVCRVFKEKFIDNIIEEIDLQRKELNQLEQSSLTSEYFEALKSVLNDFERLKELKIKTEEGEREITEQDFKNLYNGKFDELQGSDLTVKELQSLQEKLMKCKIKNYNQFLSIISKGINEISFDNLKEAEELNLKFSEINSTGKKRHQEVRQILLGSKQELASLLYENLLLSKSPLFDVREKSYVESLKEVCEQDLPRWNFYIKSDTDKEENFIGEQGDVSSAEQIKKRLKEKIESSLSPASQDKKQDRKDYINRCVEVMSSSFNQATLQKVSIFVSNALVKIVGGDPELGEDIQRVFGKGTQRDEYWLTFKEPSGFVIEDHIYCGAVLVGKISYEVEISKLKQSSKIEGSSEVGYSISNFNFELKTEGIKVRFFDKNKSLISANNFSDQFKQWLNLTKSEETMAGEELAKKFIEKFKRELAAAGELYNKERLYSEFDISELIDLVIKLEVEIKIEGIVSNNKKSLFLKLQELLSILLKDRVFEPVKGTLQTCYFQNSQTTESDFNKLLDEIQEESRGLKNKDFSQKIIKFLDKTKEKRNFLFSAKNVLSLNLVEKAELIKVFKKNIEDQKKELKTKNFNESVKVRNFIAKLSAQMEQDEILLESNKHGKNSREYRFLLDEILKESMLLSKLQNLALLLNSNVEKKGVFKKLLSELLEDKQKILWPQLSFSEELYDYLDEIQVERVSESKIVDKQNFKQILENNNKHKLVEFFKESIMNLVKTDFADCSAKTALSFALNETNMLKERLQEAEKYLPREDFKYLIEKLKKSLLEKFLEHLRGSREESGSMSRLGDLYNSLEFLIPYNKKDRNLSSIFQFLQDEILMPKTVEHAEQLVGLVKDIVMHGSGQGKDDSNKYKIRLENSKELLLKFLNQVALNIDKELKDVAKQKGLGKNIDFILQELKDLLKNLKSENTHESLLKILSNQIELISGTINHNKKSLSIEFFYDNGLYGIKEQKQSKKENKTGIEDGEIAPEEEKFVNPAVATFSK